MSIGVPYKRGNLTVINLPDQCPYCHKAITPNVIYGCIAKDSFFNVFLQCPDARCSQTFIGEYKKNAGVVHYSLAKTLTKGSIIKANFDAIIEEVSKSFIEIYNQAYYAEQEGLLEICGVGYRKALEFLIKDYCVLKFPEKQEQIEKEALAKCISNYVSDDKIKKVAKRAVWLGNDETHYIRKWEGKNLDDLKRLIALTVHWIEMEKLTEEFELDMPE